MDRLIGRVIGHGSITSSAFRLPRARYTVFVHYDPADAVQTFAMADVSGRRWPDWHGLPSPGEVTAPIVQELLPSATYRIEIQTATDACRWDVQVVLNSMQSWAFPPRPWKPVFAPPLPVAVHSGGSMTLVVERTGRYSVHWWLGEPGVHITNRHPYTLLLRAEDGHALDLGAGGSDADHRVGSVFLGAGPWVVEMTAQTAWALTVSPAVGPTGGGAWGF